MGSHEIIDRMNYDAWGLADRQSRCEYPRVLNQQGVRENFHPPGEQRWIYKYPGGVEGHKWGHSCR
jgi:hypothetical protein